MRIQYVCHLKEDLKFLQVDNQKMAKSYNKKRKPHEQCHETVHIVGLSYIIANLSPLEQIWSKG